MVVFAPRAYHGIPLIQLAATISDAFQGVSDVALLLIFQPCCRLLD